MAILKIVDNPCDTDEALANLCAYIIDEYKTQGNICGRGLNPYEAYADMVKVQSLCKKTSGRKSYHLIVSFSDSEPIADCEAKDIGFEIASLFFPDYQVLFGVHFSQAHLHIHFAVNTVNLTTGHKLHIDYSVRNQLQMQINNIIQSYID